MSRIAIIGAGLSGRLLALNLLRFASSDAAASVRMLDRGDERDMGPAYSCEADYLLLNVPAGRMGAFSENPEHFLTWNRDRGAHAAGPWDFLPRRLYREATCVNPECLSYRGALISHIELVRMGTLAPIFFCI